MSTRYKDRVLRQDGRRKLVYRDWGRWGTRGGEHVYIEEPSGRGGAVTRHWFPGIESAHRAFRGVAHTTQRTFDWALRRGGDERPTSGSDESWRIR